MAEPLVESHAELQAVPVDASRGTDSVSFTAPSAGHEEEDRREAREKLVTSLSFAESARRSSEQGRATKLRLKWAELCRELRVDIAVEDRWWGKILENYSTPQRKYHNLRQLLELHEHFHRHAGSLEDPNAVQLAIFFHAFVYTGQNGSPQNEKESATQLDFFCQEALPPGEPLGKEKGVFISKVVRWIIGYSIHQADESWEMDGKYFMDMLLARFGEPWARFEEYIGQNEEEFESTPQVMFLEGRRVLLRGLRGRALDSSYRSLYATAAFQSSHGAKALENTKRETELISERLGQFGGCSRACAKMWSFIWLGYGKYGVIAALLCFVFALIPVLWLLPALVLSFSLLYGFFKLSCCLAGYKRYPYPATRGERKGTVVIAGSYNPPHMGHLEMIKYLGEAHAAVVAVVGVNPEKVYSVSPYQRQEIMKAMCSELGLTNVKVVVWNGLVFRFAKAIGATRMYRGIRSWRQDGRGEKWLEFLNMTVPFMYGQWPIPSDYLQGAPHLANLSSSLLRRRLADEEDISDLVPIGCVEAVKQAYIPGTFFE